MKSVFRTLLAVIIGVALAFVLVIAVEWFGAVVHPIPADFNGNIGEYVRRYPHWILAIVVFAWSATSTAATWVASRIGNRIAGAVVALLLAGALVFNVTRLPYTMWFKVAVLIAVPAACLLGIRYGKRLGPTLRVGVPNGNSG